MTGGQETVQKAVRVGTHPEEVFTQFTHPEQFVELLPSLTAIEASGTLEEESQHLVLEYDTAGIATRTDLVLTHCSRPSALRYELVGDVDGELVWGFEAVGDGTEVQFELTYVLSEELLEHLPAEFVHRYNEREIASLVANFKAAVGTTQP